MPTFDQLTSPAARRRAAERDAAVAGAMAAIRQVRGQPSPPPQPPGMLPPGGVAVPGAPPPLPGMPPPALPQAQAQTMAQPGMAQPGMGQPAPPVLPDMAQIAAQAAPTLLGPGAQQMELGGIIAAQNRGLIQRGTVPAYADGGMVAEEPDPFVVPQPDLLPGVVSAEEIVERILEHEERKRGGPAANPPRAFLDWLMRPPDDAGDGVGPELLTLYEDALDDGKLDELPYLWRFVTQAAAEEPEELPASLLRIAQQG